MSGKGDGLRRGADLQKYADNYDSIFRKNENNTSKTSKKEKDKQNRNPEEKSSD